VNFSERPSEKKRSEKARIAFAAYKTRMIGSYAETIGALAVEAMLFEVTCTPSPGLVNRANSGAHSDMDFYTFMSSSAALSISMARCVQAGLNHRGVLPDLLSVLRKIGQEGEVRMLVATNGVNTQKGLLFSLGIVAAAVGWVHKNRESPDSAEILRCVSSMSAGLVARELGNLDKPESQLTAGEKLYRQYGVTGIRGEMEQGLPAVLAHGLSTLRQAIDCNLDVNQSLLQTLLVLMTVVDDTTVMNRHHPDKMRIWARNKALEVLAAGGMYTQKGQKLIATMDMEFIAHNVSPGGVADMLSVTWFLYQVENRAAKLKTPKL